MAEVRIEVGMSDGYRYLGVQPPITNEQRELLKAAEYSDSSIPDRFGIQHPDIGEPYSQSGITTAAFSTTSEANKAIVRSANNVARVLRLNQDEVIVDESLHLIGDGRYLFSGEANGSE